MINIASDILSLYLEHLNTISGRNELRIKASEFENDNVFNLFQSTWDKLNKEKYLIKVDYEHLKNMDKIQYLKLIEQKQKYISSVNEDFYQVIEDISINTIEDMEKLIDNQSIYLSITLKDNKLINLVIKKLLSYRKIEKLNLKTNTIDTFEINKIFLFKLDKNDFKKVLPLIIQILKSIERLCTSEEYYISSNNAEIMTNFITYLVNHEELIILNKIQGFTHNIKVNNTNNYSTAGIFDIATKLPPLKSVHLKNMRELEFLKKFKGIHSLCIKKPYHLGKVWTIAGEIQIRHLCIDYIKDLSHVIIYIKEKKNILNSLRSIVINEVNELNEWNNFVKLLKSKILPKLQYVCISEHLIIL